jgi:hypothetical protein
VLCNMIKPADGSTCRFYKVSRLVQDDMLRLLCRVKFNSPGTIIEWKNEDIGHNPRKATRVDARLLCHF